MNSYARVRIQNVSNPGSYLPEVKKIRHTMIMDHLQTLCVKRVGVVQLFAP